MAIEPRPYTETDHVRQEASAVEARQGVISGRVVTVLVVSLVLAIVALAIGYFIVH